MEKTSTKLSVIVITTAAIIAAATTTSLSAAIPAFAKINCNEDETICSGGSSLKAQGIDIPGGGGGHSDRSAGQASVSGGFGQNGGGSVGGTGVHQLCDPGCNPPAGGSGLHPK
jgi:hypothetical protein